MTLQSPESAYDPRQPSTDLTLDGGISATYNAERQEELRRLARQKNLEALTDLINQCLSEHSIQVADLEFKSEKLQLSVESAEVPEPAVTLPLLRAYLSQLQLPSVTTVTVYGQKLRQELPYWMETIELDLLFIEPQTEAKAALEGLAGQKPPVVLPEPDPFPSEVALQLTEKYEAGERNFAQINLKDEALPGINLTLTDLQAANLVWCNLRKASLSHANLTSAELRHADLTDANLQGATLQGTDLQGAKLQGANLSWAVLRGTNLTDADLTDVNFQNATLERVIMPDGTILD
ncbi:pentapeptide repeat-containing protein [Acaryochloris sp. IP29b_bin.148]|uniref:pentapeptide repeat-containing protein n=1 Tax=Acaryochloris sp. IP29b_bin.148 TaxID=2969218 RepID=UPI00261656B7|nr:pentapeptide repeat-containing protein [Acaryochloris sp. IP29b_bin.148]